MLLGNKIRELRDEQKLLQRQLAAVLEIDTPMFSKIERGDRRAKREQVVKLAELLHQDENEMLKLWLADKVIDAVGNENDSALKRDAIKVAQKEFGLIKMEMCIKEKCQILYGLIITTPKKRG